MRHLASRRSSGSDCLSELSSSCLPSTCVMCPWLIWQSVVRTMICSEEVITGVHDRIRTRQTAAPGKHTQMGGISPHSVRPAVSLRNTESLPHDSAIRGRTPSGGTSHELYPGGMSCGNATTLSRRSARLFQQLGLSSGATLRACC